MATCALGNHRMVRFLLQRLDSEAVNVQVQREHLAAELPDPEEWSGATALICAAAFGRRRCVELLLARGDVDRALRRGDGCTALDAAERGAHAAVVKLLAASEQRSAAAGANEHRSCAACCETREKLLRCGRCKRARYCSREW